jgi:ribosomal protein S18 acetylase RimI-like enzyme
MQQEKINLKRATTEDVDIVLKTEKSLDGSRTYSALIDKQEVLKEIANSIFYLIEKDGKTVGDTSYEMKDKGRAYISGLGIMPPFQGQGIARQTMEMILEELKNVKVIDLVTHPENKKAISLYETLGFEQIGEPIENYFNDGEPRIKMVLKKIKK